MLGSDPDGYPIRPPGPRAFRHVSSKPRCQRRQEGPTSMDQAVHFPLSIPLSAVPAAPTPHPRHLQGPPLVSCHQAVGSSGVGGGQTLLYPSPSGRSVPGPRALCSFLRSVGSSPREAGFLLYSHRCAGSRGVRGGNTLDKVRPIPPDTHGQVTLGSCSPGPLPILTTPSRERSWPGPGLASKRFSTAATPVVLPGSRWTPGARGACASPVV